MKRGRRPNLVKRIGKLLASPLEADKELGKEALLVKIGEIHPDHWEKLNTESESINWWNTHKTVHTHWNLKEVQTYLYDKANQDKSSGT